ncbi:MAG: hypothetical protein QM569_09760 [Acidovorax sp.]|uniref:hypothetical protein n=1 Tax=Acidovorax sp. TaxID=1872122 RepID=UPI0039E5F1B4
MPDFPLSSACLFAAANTARQKAAADAQRPKNAPPPATARRPLTPAELRDVAAQPDSEFHSNPTAQRFLAAIQECRAQLATDLRSRLNDARTGLVTAIERRERFIVSTVFEDSTNKDVEFTSTRRSIAAMESDRALLQAVDAAINALDSDPNAIPDDSKLRSMRDGLSRVLWDLKVERASRLKGLNDGNP